MSNLSKISKVQEEDNKLELSFHLMGYTKVEYVDGFTMKSPNKRIEIANKFNPIKGSIYSFFFMYLFRPHGLTIEFKAPTIEAALAKAAEWNG